MPAPAERAATYADIEALPANMVGELLDGEFIAQPRPLPRHSIAATALGSELAGPFQKGRGGPGGWLFMTEPQLHLGPHVVVPDLAGWRRERLPTLPDKVGITVPPDWVCEILSPSTASYDRTIKLRIYHEHRVGHLWYLDPAYRTLEVYGWGEPHWLALGTFADFETATAPPFEAISIELGVLWPFDTPPQARG